jgi:hypothetical protein
MKQILLSLFTISVLLTACDSKKTETATAVSSGDTSKMTFPYTASYTTEFTNEVSDADLLTVLNSYKYWETGDMAALRATMGDSMEVNGSDGFIFKGKTDSLMNVWKLHRDSMSSVVITMDVWLKNHALKDSADYVNIWYKEVDTYKSGRVDSAYYSDVNALKKGKIVWFSSFRQNLKKK